MPVNVATEALERGVVGTAKTIEKMHRLVALGKLDPTMQRIATWIRLQVPGDPRANTRAVLDEVFGFVRRHGIFQRDPFQIEKIEHPVEAMRPIIEARRAGKYRGPGLFVGDCDTIAGVYLAALGGILGFQYAFETAKVDPSRPDEFSHVWVAFLTRGEWVPMDPSTPGTSPGWRPQVRPENFRRWPEGPIEDAAGMSGLTRNGIPNGDLYVPSSYYGYGVPKSFDEFHSPDVPEADAGRAAMLMPPGTALEPAQLEPDVTVFTKKVPALRAEQRIGDYAQVDWRRPHLVGKRPYVSTEVAYPGAENYWNGPRKRILYEPRKRYVDVERQRTPYERQVEVAMAQPMTVFPRGEMIVMRPRLEAAGMEQAYAGLVTGAATAQQQQAATEASKGVWETITSTIKSAIPGATEAAVLRTQARYAERLAKATTAATGVPVSPDIYAPTPARAWYSSPWVLLGGALVVGGVAYAATRGGGPRRRRRR